jgi:hypothetical protein
MVTLMRHVAGRGVRIGHFVMIAAYVDESASHSSAPVLSVAITATTLKCWQGFETEWFPKIDHLRDGYHANRCGDLHPALSELMVKYTLFSSYITLREGEYHQHFPKWVQSVLGGPYHMGVLMSLLTYARWSRIPGNAAGRAYYFIEQGHRGFPHLATLMTVIMRSAELREMFAMAGWSPATKEDWPVHCPDTISHLATERYGSGTHAPLIAALYDAGALWRGHMPEKLFRENAHLFKEAAKMTLRGVKADRDYRRAQRRAAKKSGGA